MFIAFDHVDESGDLFFILLTNLLIAVYLELETARLIYPVCTFAPSCSVSQLFKHIPKLCLGGLDVFLVRIDDEIVVLGEHGHQGGLLVFCTPWKLFEEAE